MPPQGKVEAKFNENIQKPEDVFNILKNGNKSSQFTIDGDKYTGSAFTKYIDMLKAQGIVTKEQDLIDKITNNNISFQGRKISQVAHELKKAYRQQVIERMVISNPTPDELKEFRAKYPYLPWNNSNNPADNQQALNQVRYIKFKEIATSLDPADKGSLGEIWHEKIYPQPGSSTQVSADKIKMKDDYDIELQTEKRRRFDRVLGPENNATINEIKTISGELKGDQLLQYEDNIKILTNNRTKNGKVIELIENGRKYQIRKLRYTFTLPEGVKANAEWMREELLNHRNRLTFEIFNSRGERKIINFNNRNELNRKVLNNWLYP